MEQTDHRAGPPRAARHLVMVASLVVIIAGMRAASSVLVLLLLAAFFAAICTVPLTWLQRRAVPSKLAVGLIAGGILAFGSLLVVLVALSVNSFLGDLPKNQERLSALTASAIGWLNAHGVHVSGEALRQHFDLGNVMSFVGAMLAGLSGVLAGGFLAFLLNFVPYIGCYIAPIPPLLLALADRGTGPALLALLGYLTVNAVLGNLVEPRLMGAQLGLSALVVFASLLIWGWVLGPVGMILSVPLTVLLRIALEAKEDTRWIAILLGPAEPPERKVAGGKRWDEPAWSKR
jgi:predicted PurR-regulated permease PerM